MKEKTGTSGRLKRTGHLTLAVVFLLSLQFQFLPDAFPSPLDTPAAGGSIPEVDPGIEDSHLVFLDSSENSFAIFSNREILDVPEVTGRVEWKEGIPQFHPTLWIDHLETLYILRAPSEGAHLSVIERLPEGGFGRLLRYRGIGQSGQWVDLEFIYDDAQDQLTILDRLEGQFFRTTFAKGRPVPVAVTPATEKRQTPNLRATGPSGNKKFSLGNQPVLIEPQIQVGRLLPQVSGFRKSDAWLRWHLRGPPKEVLLP
ncbi:MAG: hypothetical protein HYU34_04860 [Candidatus Omnitrophica bacterium]|nr:hypothetical protein [Candidatus Omnitrophota bacterium]